MLTETRSLPRSGSISSTTPLSHPLNIQADLGDGAEDRLFVEMNQGVGTGGSLSVNLYGTLGQSAVDVTVGPLNQGTFNIQEHLADLGKSNDMYKATLPGQVERVYIAE